MEEILHQLIGGSSHYLYLFIGFQPCKVVQDFATIHSISMDTFIVTTWGLIYSMDIDTDFRWIGTIFTWNITMDPDPDWFSNTTFDVFNALSDWFEIDTDFRWIFQCNFWAVPVDCPEKKNNPLAWGYHEDIIVPGLTGAQDSEKCRDHKKRMAYSYVLCS